MTALSDAVVPEISVQELKQLLDNNQKPFVLDVRQEFEYSIANLGGHLIPLNQLSDRLNELDEHLASDQLTVVHCRSGVRSAQAVRFLHAVGYTNTKNLRGGILAWSKEIDPSIPTY
ncbi:MAG: rhodanese-like domain-containing protein [Bacteroidetes bacterium]|nr:rhodanese-like domain-containing protein [Bacteroidota bacterium]MCY4225988.1 rhodanese-like domain-containing protein [Bacteroidota bacterium]